MRSSIFQEMLLLQGNDNRNLYKMHYFLEKYDDILGTKRKKLRYLKNDREENVAFNFIAFILQFRKHD